MKDFCMKGLQAIATANLVQAIALFRMVNPGLFEAYVDGLDDPFEKTVVLDDTPAPAGTWLS